MLRVRALDPKAHICPNIFYPENIPDEVTCTHDHIQHG